MFKLDISFHATSHSALFETKEEAQRELDAIKPLIGKKYYGDNGNERTHTVKCSQGDFVVSLEKVESARVVDCEEWDRLATSQSDKAWKIELARRVELKAALRDGNSP